VLADYLRELQRVDILTAPEEAALWKAYRLQGDVESRLRLIEAYQPLVFKLAMQVKPPDALLMDVIQEGTVGLIEAVERFDPERGVLFSTFAVYRIRGRILNVLGRERIDLSLDQALVEEARDAVGRAKLSAALADAGAEEALARVEDRVLLEQIQEAMANLPQRDRSVLAAYVGKAEARSVASELRVSLSHFYRLQKQAIDRLRRSILAPAPDRV
jgi:RNA polymerase sporulation-specific sigma factor